MNKFLDRNVSALVCLRSDNTSLRSFDRLQEARGRSGWRLNVPYFRIGMVAKGREVDWFVLDLWSVTLFEEGVD